MTRFGILGPLEVVHEGRAVVLGGPRQRAVLARLLLDAGRSVSADRLVDDVWGGRPPATAAKTLQKYVSELRKVLPAGDVRTVPGGYLVDGMAELDARSFERLVGLGRYRDALALWRGEVLADLADATFADAERTRLSELRLFALESMLEAELAAGGHGAVVGELLDLVERHPVRERLTCLLMLALYRSGRQVEALEAYDAHRRYLADELGLDPAESVSRVQAAILRHDPGLDLRSVPTVVPATGNLPTPLTALFGRADDLRRLGDLVATHRLVTLTGPGGVGKTRRAVELGHHLTGSFPGGAWVADLSAVETPAVVTRVVAGALDVDTRHAPDELTALLASLARRPACLLVLDNCEHVAATVADLVRSVLHAAADLRVLATSRRPLGVDGEYVQPLSPLDAATAVELLADRARLVGTELSAEEAAEICGRLDALPLAIELAASQLRVLAPSEVVEHLADRLAFRGRTATAARQRTLGDMVRWSYDLLPGDARRTFERLGVFAGPVSLEAAAAVSADPADTAHDVLGSIATLIDHSLLVREPGASPSRYRMLDTLRLFALARLDESGATTDARRAHAEHLVSLATSAGPHLYGPDEVGWERRVRTMDADLQAALGWCSVHDPALAVRLAVALSPYWEVRWKERPGVAFLEPLLSGSVGLPGDLRAWALTAIAGLRSNYGDARDAVRHAEAAVELFRELGDRHGLAAALDALGSALGNAGRLDDAAVAVEEAAALCRELGLTARTAMWMRGYLAMRKGDFEAAATASREELEHMLAIGSRRGQATAERHLAISLNHLADHDEAMRLAEHALELWRELDDQAAIAHVRTTMADIARTRGDLPTALELYDEALTVLEAIADRRCTASTHKNVATIATARGDQRRAHGLFRQALTIRHELGDDAGLAEVLEGLAGLDRVVPDEDAAAMLGAAARLRDESGARSSSAEAELVARTLTCVRARLGPGTFAERHSSGRALPVDAIVELSSHVRA